MDMKPGEKTEADDPMIGRIIGEWRIEKLLGRGGMGAVYYGMHVEKNRPAAIKVMLRTLGENPEMTHRFEREARLAAEVDHPNVARVLAHGNAGDVRFLAMEYIDGESLASLIKERGRISGSRSIDLVRQCARGLQAAHERGIIHRDIKPANLMLTRDGIVKVVDFGLARAEDANESFNTASGQVLGTPHYMAPEQAGGMRADHRADIYSLGCSFYHMLTGHTPFSGETSFAILQKHIRDDVKAVTSWNPNVPQQVCQIVYRMMEKNPDDRFQTYGHLISVLDDAIEGRAATMTMEVVDERRGAGREPVVDGKDRTRLVLAALMAAVIVLGGFALKQQLDKKKAVEAATEAAKPAADTIVSRSGFKRETLPMLHDISKEIRERDKDSTDFESRRERMNKGE